MWASIWSSERLLTYLYSLFKNKLSLLVPDTGFLVKLCLVLLESIYLIQSVASLSEPSNLLWLLWLCSLVQEIDSKEWNMLFLLVIWTRGLLVKNDSKVKSMPWIRVVFVLLNSYSLVSLLFKVYRLLEVSLVVDLHDLDSWVRIERLILLKPLALVTWFMQRLRNLT